MIRQWTIINNTIHINERCFIQFTDEDKARELCQKHNKSRDMRDYWTYTHVAALLEEKNLEVIKHHNEQLVTMLLKGEYYD